MNDQLTTNKENIFNYEIFKNTPSVCNKVYTLPNIVITSFDDNYPLNLLNNILVNTPSDFLKVMVIDTRRLTFLGFENLSYLVCDILNETKEISMALDIINKEISNRYDILCDNNVRNIENYNLKQITNCKNCFQNIIIFINDLYDLIIDKTIKEQLIQIFMNGKKVGITIIAFTNTDLKYLKIDLIKNYFTCLTEEKFDTQIENYLWSTDYKYPINKNPNYGLSKQDSKNEKNDDDPLYDEVLEFVINQGKVSASLLQRRFKFNYHRAAHIINLLEDKGIIGPPNGSKPREVLIKK